MTIDRKIFLLSFILLLLALSSFSQQISTVAGGIGDGKPAAQAQLYFPSGIAIDNQGNIFLADASNGLVRRIDGLTGIITTVAGNGERGSAGDGGQAVNAQLYNPTGVELDGAGNLYICDPGNSLLRKVDLSTGIISRVAGTAGVLGFDGDGGYALNAKFTGPESVCFDAIGNIYLADKFNHRVRKIEKLSGIITTIAGTGVSGYNGDGGLAAYAQLSFPADLIMDNSGNLIIADSNNNRIRKVNLTTSIISTIVGNGTSGPNGDNVLATADAQLSGPQSIALDINGNLFITEATRRVRKVDAISNIITTIAGQGGSGGYSGDGGPAVDALLSGPKGLAFNSNGDLYIVLRGGPDGSDGRVRKIDVSGIISTIAGNGGFFGDGDAAVNASLRNPRGIAFDSDGSLLIADEFNFRIRRINRSTGIISTVAGIGIEGFSGDAPELALTAKLSRLKAIAIDKSDNIYFSDATRIRKIDHATGEITTAAGNGNAGFNGDNLPATDTWLNSPEGIAIGENGDIYFSDTFNQRVRKISKATNIITTVAGDGTNGFAGDNGLGSNAKLQHPAGLLIYSGKLYIADRINNRIRRVDLTTGIITTAAGGGLQQSDNISALDANLNSPQAIAFDSNNNLVIVSAGLGSIRKVDKDSNLIKTIVGSGLPGFSGDDGPPLLARLSPSAIAFDSNGDLYISDYGNNRIRKVSRFNQAIGFDPLLPFNFDHTSFNLSAIATSNLPVSYTSSNEAVATISGNTVTIVGAGNTTITAKQSGNDAYYAATNVVQTLIVSKANQTISFNPLPIKTIGEAPFNLPATTNSSLPVSYTSSDETVAKVSGNTVTIVGLGTTNITAKQMGNVNYNAATDVTQTLTVVIKVDQVITFGSIAAKIFGDTPFTLSATTSSTLPISYTSSDETVATISGNTVTIVGAGSTNIIAKQSGNTNYNAATEVLQTLTVNKANQAITFPAISAKTFGDMPFNLTGTSSSGLAVQYSTPSDKISLNGSQVTLNKPGSVTLNAGQPGNGNYNSVEAVSHTFCINPSKPNITATGLNSGTPVLTSSSSIGNQWYKNGTLLTDEVSNTLSPNSDGSYTVKVTVDNCTSELSAEQILVITGDITSSSISSFLVYPNPVKDNLSINLTSFEPTVQVEIVIYDVSGKVMDKILKQGEKATVAVGSYSIGTYFIKASQGSLSLVAKFAKE